MTKVMTRCHNEQGGPASVHPDPTDDAVMTTFGFVIERTWPTSTFASGDLRVVADEQRPSSANRKGPLTCIFSGGGWI
jgi:hypothetical protein